MLKCLQELDDTKGAILIRKWKRTDNAIATRIRTDNTIATRIRTDNTTATRIRTNNDLQITTQKTKDRSTQTPLKAGCDLRCSEKVSSSCSTSETRRVTVK